MTKPPAHDRPEKPKRPLRPVNVSADLTQDLDLDAIAKAAGLSDDERAKFAERVEETRRWLRDDPKANERFAAAPLSVLAERFDEIARFPTHIKEIFLPGSDEEACAGNAAANTALAGCAKKLVERVIEWIDVSPANRAAFEANPDAAVDAVVTSAFPSAAVVLVKSAFQAARRLP